MKTFWPPDTGAMLALVRRLKAMGWIDPWVITSWDALSTEAAGDLMDWKRRFEDAPRTGDEPNIRAFLDSNGRYCVAMRLSSESITEAEAPQEWGWVVVVVRHEADAQSSEGMQLLRREGVRLAALAMQNDYEKLLEGRVQFLSMVSHELKTPLTAISGLLQLQERIARKKGEPNDSNLILLKQIQKLDRLIDALLNVSRIYSGRFSVEPSRTEVNDLLRDTVQSKLKVIADDATVRLELDLLPSPLFARLDPVRFEEVVTNLGMNAIRFSPEGGVVNFKLRGEAEALCLRVTDSGPSIPVQDAERVFKPFEQAQRTSRLGGMGLGLFISREILKLHHGELKLLPSSLPTGNSFEAIFPQSLAAS